MLADWEGVPRESVRRCEDLEIEDRLRLLKAEREQIDDRSLAPGGVGAMCQSVYIDWHIASDHPRLA